MSVPADGLDAVLTAFGIEPGAAALHALTAGKTNAVWRCSAAHGEFVVRRHALALARLSDLRYQHALQHHLAIRLTFVRAPLRTTGGETFLVAGDSAWSIVGYIEGSTGPGGPAAAHAAAALLAKFHAAAASFDAGADERRNGSLDVLAWCREMALVFEAQAPADSGRWSLLRKRCTAAARVLAQLGDAVPRLAVHGDFHAHNVVRRGGRAVGLIDFDAAHHSERVYDVAALLDNFCRAEKSDPLDLALAAAVLAGYDRHAALAPAERAALPAALVRRSAAKIVELERARAAGTPGLERELALYWRRLGWTGPTGAGDRDAAGWGDGEPLDAGTPSLLRSPAWASAVER